ncbi:MAG TPA: ABC transporter permease [Candidatus Acidoferrum sp.]|nr:ABC transporter permease [Candidatus Acidoferrum sp.]
MFTYLKSMAVVVCVWWAVSLWLARPYLLPPPATVASAAFKLLTSGRVAAAIAVSGQRLLLAYVLAAGIGVPLGIGMGLSRWMADLFDWLIEMVRPISGIAWIPVLLVVFGVSNALPMAIIFYAAIFPFILNSASGVRHVDPRLTSAAQVLGARRWRIILTVVLPAVVPDIMTGARIAASNSWMALIVAELIGAPNGLGFSVGYAQELGNATLVLAWIIYIGVCGYVLDTTLHWLQGRLTPWRVGLKVGG